MKICLLPLCVSLTLAACSTLPEQQNRAAQGLDGLPCVGQINSAEGLVPAHDDALLRRAQGAQGKGGLCAAAVFQAADYVKVYRIWDASKPNSMQGRWWALSRPVGPRDRYRQDYAICPSWSALDRYATCLLKPGSVIAIGTTQSADCGADGSMAQTEANQVYIENGNPAGALYTEQCEEGAWP